VMTELAGLNNNSKGTICTSAADGEDSSEAAAPSAPELAWRRMSSASMSSATSDTDTAIALPSFEEPMVAMSGRNRAFEIC